MKKITTEELPKGIHTSSPRSYILGYNAACDESNKEIQDLLERLDFALKERDRWMNDYFKNKIYESSKPREEQLEYWKMQYNQLTEELDEWKDRCEKLELSFESAYRRGHEDGRVFKEPTCDKSSHIIRDCSTCSHEDTPTDEELWDFKDNPDPVRYGPRPTDAYVFEPSPELTDLLSKPDLVKEQPETLTTNDCKLSLASLMEMKRRIKKLEEDFNGKHLSEYSYDLKKVNDNIDVLQNHKNVQRIWNAEINKIFDHLIDKVSKLECNSAIFIDQIHDLEEHMKNAVMNGNGVEIVAGYNVIQSKGIITKIK